MGSKAIVFLGLLVVMLLVSSEVAARELVEETSAKATEVEPAQRGGGGGGGGGHCRHRCCGRYGCRCCSHPGEDVDADFNEAETHN